MKHVSFLQLFPNIMVSGIALLLVWAVAGCNKDNKKIEEYRNPGTHKGFFTATLNDSTIWSFNRVSMICNKQQNKLYMECIVYPYSSSVTFASILLFGLAVNLNKQPLSIPILDSTIWNEKSSIFLYAHDEDVTIGDWTLDTTQNNYLQFTEINEEKGILRGKFQLTASISDKEEGYTIPFPDRVKFTNGEFEILGAWKYSD